jgi:hypothetical protein
VFSRNTSVKCAGYTDKVYDRVVPGTADTNSLNKPALMNG